MGNIIRVGHLNQDPNAENENGTEESSTAEKQ